MLNKIYLIGMPGVGKTTVAQKLAEDLGLTFIDLDCLIEGTTKKKITELFNYGEAYFRDIETKTLKSTMNLDNCVIACGGGIVEREDNLNYFNGHIIYLEANLSSIEERLIKSDIVRPLLVKEKLLNLYERRHLKYKKFADYIIENNDVEKTVKDLINYIKDENTSN